VTEQVVEARKRLLSVFRFVQAINHRRNPPQRHINSQPWRHWLHDLPDHECIDVASVLEDEAGESETSENESSAALQVLVRVRRPDLTSPPAPPDDLLPWLLRGWDDPSRQPVVRDALSHESADGSTSVVRFEDDAERVKSFGAWLNDHAAWAAAEKPARDALRCFEQFYELWGRMERDSESFELVLGDGILDWNLSEGRVQHPLLLQRVDLLFDAKLAEFTVVDTDTAPDLYSALLQSIGEVEGASLRAIRTELADGGYHPLGESGTTGFLRAVITRISPHGKFIAERSESTGADAARLWRAPVLFLRSRSLGFATCIQEVLDELASGSPIPPSLTRVVGIDPEATFDDERGVIATERAGVVRTPSEDEVLFSLPANLEQLRIAQRLSADGGVLVQGPPGTGKTHTIANLLGHLLAQGKSVLVTSHTTKALGVLREKVAGELQPLCISVLESDAEGRKLLENSVSEIAERLSRTDVDQSLRRAEALETERLQLIRTLREKIAQLNSARADEYRPIVIGGRSWDPSDAARWVARTRESHSWIPTPITRGAPLPLSREELGRLYAISRDLSLEDEAEISGVLPDPSSLPTAADFEMQAAIRAELLDENREPNVRYWPGESEIQVPEELEHALAGVIDAVEALPVREPWKMAVALAGLRGGGHREPWEQLARIVSEAQQQSAAAQVYLAQHSPKLSSIVSVDEQLGVFREIVDRLKRGKKLSGTRVFLKSAWKRVLGSVSVGERSPATLEHFEALEVAASLERTRQSLRERWDAQVKAHKGPAAADLAGEIEHSLGMLMPVLASFLNWHGERWLVALNRLSDLGFSWEAFERDQPLPGGDGSELTRVYQSSGQPLVEAIRPKLARLRWDKIGAAQERAFTFLGQHERIHGNLPPVAQDVLRAIRALSPQAYEVALRRLSQLWASRSLQAERQTLLSRLASAAPEWAARVSQRTQPHDQADPPGDVDEAWVWRQLEEELLSRAATSIVDLQAAIDSIKDRIRSVTTDLISCRSWAEQSKRTSLRQRQALIGWLDAVRRLGKHGTVKKAALLKRQAQENLSEARSAVPVWIMPTSRVVESFRPSDPKFDVAIIDEASQCDLTSLVVLFLAKSAIIVGDHEQVSPAAVGEDQTLVQRLVQEYLSDVPNRALYDSRLSVYDLARQSFGETICLVEHFRSVPEIIGFSNQLSYEGRIKPLRESGAALVRPSLIPYRVEARGASGKLNQEEARSVASLLVAMCKEPEYAKATFGVISLVGEETAFETDRLIRLRLDPVEYQRRKVRCGNPAQFQGDERDVILISMVDTPGDGPLAMRQDAEWKKRFNVASSRARDQQWVVHSLDRSIDLKPGDLRRQLIEHATDPTAIERSVAAAVLRAESPFESAVIKRLVEANYRVRPQFPVGHYRIDIVVEGSTRRLAIECDGDRYHPLEKLGEDLARQEILERLGWRFVRIRGSSFFSDPSTAMKPVFDKVDALGIERLGPRGEVQETSSLRSDLVERVVRRAAQLREEWATEEAEAPLLRRHTKARHVPAIGGLHRAVFRRVRFLRHPKQS
jgi:very-short-patch-repair endonuclease